MDSWVFRMNNREIGVVQTALAKYHAALLKETKGTTFMRDSYEGQVILKLLDKLNKKQPLE